VDLRSVTPLIITHNEEANIGRALARLTWAERIVVVDSLSTDGTTEIARSNPRVDLIQRQFDSFAGQCNHGLEHIATEWVLSLDADYICSDALTREIAALSDHPAENGFAVAFRYCIGGRPLRATLYPDRTVLYRRSRARYVEDGHAHRVQVPGAIGRLSSLIEHDDRKSLATWLLAQQQYAEKERDKLEAIPPHALKWQDRLRRRKWIVPVVMPVYCLLIRGLILDGRDGWYYTFQRTYAELLLSLTLADVEHGLASPEISHTAPGHSPDVVRTT
jgi:glycosyltransferase involved in cell wall biosynthesis